MPVKYSSHEIVSKNKRLNRIWRAMKSRCNNKNASNYKWYGGKGIKVCKDWQVFETFADWALSNGYADGLTIDRIYNDKDYCPENCRWIPAIKQQRNQSNNHLLTIRGETKLLTDWARQIGISHETLWARLKVLGWSPEKAISTPIRRRGL